MVTRFGCLDFTREVQKTKEQSILKIVALRPLLKLYWKMLLLVPKYIQTITVGIVALSSTTNTTLSTESSARVRTLQNFNAQTVLSRCGLRLNEDSDFMAAAIGFICSTIWMRLCGRSRLRCSRIELISCCS
jgi:hypothetical protein